MRNNEVIQLGDSLQGAIAKLSEGNPGALRVLCDCVKESAAIDPDSFLRDWTALINLDSNGIRGSKIWMLFNDVCGENIGRMIGALRAVQLGMISSEALEAAINEGRSHALDIPELVRMVRARLPKFDAANVSAVTLADAEIIVTPRT